MAKIKEFMDWGLEEKLRKFKEIMDYSFWVNKVEI